MREYGELEITNQQLVEIAEFAERVQRGEVSMNAADLAFALQVVALSLHRIQAGEPDSPYGEAVDRWYDFAIGQNVRIMWTKVKPAIEKLRHCGVLQ